MSDFEQLVKYPLVHTAESAKAIAIALERDVEVGVAERVRRLDAAETASKIAIALDCSGGDPEEFERFM